MTGRLLVAGLALSALGAAEELLLDQGYRDMYNLAFGAAHESFRRWERLHPDDPMGPVSDAAAFLFAEFDRLRILQSELFVEDRRFRTLARQPADPAVRAQFQEALGRSERLARSILVKEPADRRALLATVLRLGLWADYLALIERKDLAALSAIKEARSNAERLLALHPDCADAHLAVGVENYLLSLKPLLVRWLLRLGGARTDEQQGLERLRITAERGRYLKPYAQLLLAVAELRSHRPEAARSILRSLAEQFPGNRLFREELERLP